MINRQAKTLKKMQCSTDKRMNQCWKERKKHRYFSNRIYISAAKMNIWTYQWSKYDIRISAPKSNKSVQKKWEKSAVITGNGIYKHRNVEWSDIGTEKREKSAVISRNSNIKALKKSMKWYWDWKERKKRCYFPK